MGNALSGVEAPLDDPGVVAAQSRLDDASRVWVDVGIEAGLLVASSSPVGGQVADGISLARNVAAGNYVDAIVDGVGFVPVLGDLFKGFFRGRKIKRAVEAADKALDAARSGLKRAQEIARRRIASTRYWDAIKRRRDEILKKYESCSKAPCRKQRDDELRAMYRENGVNLPAESTGTWKNADGTPAPLGEGIFVPDPNDPVGAKLADSLEYHGVNGVPYSNGQPDLSGFPPPGAAGPDGKVWSVDIEQSLSGSRDLDKRASWAAWREQYGADFSDPYDGHWHHSGNGSTMQYVDQDIHSALSHTGDASINQTPEF
ncbi:A nuclease of the HNH/ENDO VII superfamily with conserved WHH [Paracoccus halophilus]|uniref:A nuclease of the HNH/ENDO VII superfamily with conserved WHH n=1 Tax=Paracoccus halophilus TaxID=376733 RepID=A0A1I0UF79_9RHOB|nr:HNH endonuclease [Paracoccus halophilus]SFA62709.1 A nuclease of the HNH/ENDO VII superfamily with conserved WHH [Paracoccus halophilus]